MEDRERILNLAPWLFDQKLFSMVPYVKNRDFSEYNFSKVPFWVCIFNIPLENMDRQMVLEVGGSTGVIRMGVGWSS